MTSSSCPDAKLLSSSGLAPALLSFSVGMLKKQISYACKQASKQS